MHGKKLFAGLVVVAGVAWAVASAQRPPLQEAAPELPTPLPEPPAPAPASRRSFRRRFATTLVFTAVFFAGAALAAGAGNELASVDPGSTDPAALVAADATDAGTTTDAETTATDGAVTDPATTAVPAVTDPAAVDTTSTDTSTDATAAATTSDETTTTTTDETTTAADPSDATPPPAPETDPLPVAPAPAPTPAAAVPTVHRVVHAAARMKVQQHAAAPARAVSPFPVVPFDPQAWLADNPGTPTGNAVVAIAEHYLGVPYRWGGNTPATGFDCSGLTQFVYAQLGIWLPHYAAAQFLAYPRLDPSQLEPGDLVFFEPKADGPGHVAIYAGNGAIIEAPHTGATVRIGSLAGAAASLGFLGAVRPSQAETTFASTAAAAPQRTIEGRFIAE
jgi:cell wall-associated NlpC family hydrolase